VKGFILLGHVFCSREVQSLTRRRHKEEERRVRALGLPLDELVEIVRTCDAFQFEGSTPPHFQDFIALRLKKTSPDLSGAVRMLDAEQMDRLYAHIIDTYALLRG
jgi:hypothetical protein